MNIFLGACCVAVAVQLARNEWMGVVLLVSRSDVESNVISSVVLCHHFFATDVVLGVTCISH